MQDDEKAAFCLLFKINGKLMYLDISLYSKQLSAAPFGVKITGLFALAYDQFLQ